MDSNQLLDGLCGLLPAQFDYIVSRLGLPTQFLSSREVALATRATEVIQVLDKANRLRELEELLAPTAVKSTSSPAAAPTVLFLGAAPIEAVRLALGREVKEIERSLRESEDGRRIKVEQEWAVRSTDLQAILLRYRPQVVHFSGHGIKSGALVFETDGDRSQPIAPDALGRLFAVLGGGVRCVVLNACYTEVQAKVLAEHVDCVIGMKDAVRDDAAILFATSFYLGLAHGESVRRAVAMGCSQVEMGLPTRGAGRRDITAADDGDMQSARRLSPAELPVLITRPGVDPEAIRLVEPPRARR